MLGAAHTQPTACAPERHKTCGRMPARPGGCSGAYRAPPPSAGRLETRQLPSPQWRPNARNLRRSDGRSAQGRTTRSAGLSPWFEGRGRTTENRGVPGSSPGLAINKSPANCRPSTDSPSAAGQREGRSSAFSGLFGDVPPRLSYVGWGRASAASSSAHGLTSTLVCSCVRSLSAAWRSPARSSRRVRV
jgi:hypothetical protein